jgi:branched-chain amino acid aminotransferase
MNMFFQVINDEGKAELITAPLTDGTILPGVVRNTVLEISKNFGVKAVEKQFTMFDVAKWSKENRIIEAFGTGTAAIVAPVDLIHWKDEDYKIPTTHEQSLAKKLRDYLLAIQHGEIPSKYVRNVLSYL